jgi:hypothetical protein
VDKSFRKGATDLISSEMGTEAVAPLLYDLVMLHRPRRILEIGGGLSSLYLLKGLADCDAAMEGERSSSREKGSLLNRSYYDASSSPSRMHMIDNFSHIDTTANKVAQTASDLGIDGPLVVHEAYFNGFAGKLPKEDLPFDMVWFDCGHIENFQHFRNHFWPLVNKNGGLILMHSLATNFHGQMFLAELKLDQATNSFKEFEMMTLMEPHKLMQNSITCIRLTGDLHTQIHSVMP